MSKKKNLFQIHLLRMKKVISAHICLLYGHTLVTAGAQLKYDVVSTKMHVQRKICRFASIAH